MGCISVLSEITVQNNVYLNLECKQVVLLASFDHKVHKVATDGWKARTVAQTFLFCLCFGRDVLRMAISHHTLLASRRWHRDPAGMGRQCTAPNPKGALLTAKSMGFKALDFFPMLRIRILMLKEIQGRFLNMDSRMQLLRNLWMSSHTHTPQTHQMFKKNSWVFIWNTDS